MKYIDAEKLIAEIERLIKEHKKALNKEDNTIIVEAMLKGSLNAYEYIKHFLSSLQQEQLESSKSKFVFPNFLYVRTKDNKTIDVSYAPQSIDAVEYIKNDYTEQPEVDLEKEIDDWYNTTGIPVTADALKETARHFYELGLNARKEK